MRAIIAILSIMTVNLNSFAGEHRPSVKEIMVQKYSKLLQKSYEDGVSQYTKIDNDPMKLLNYFTAEDKTYLANLIKKYDIKKLPPIKKHKKGYALEVAGNSIYLPSSFILDQKIFFNGKLFKFNKALSLEENSKRLQSFMGIKKTVWIPSFIIEDANALICGGLCVGGLVLGSVALGALVYHSVSKIFADETEDMKKFREEIQSKKRLCETDLNNVEAYSRYSTSYEKAPGAYETFSNMKNLVNHLAEMDDGEQSAQEAIQQQIYKDYGIDNMKNCSDFAKEFTRKLGITSKKNAQIDEIMGKNKDSKDAICAEINTYIDCLNEFNKVHRTHVNQGDGYKKDIGVYFESDAHPKSLQK